VFHHLAKGLAASHHATVVHRDLKPSNIMVVDGELFNEVKITDFGIAKMAEEELIAVEGGESSLTASNTAIGALPYMAPEMIKSIRKAGAPADVWSLGAMVFELLSGQKPFGVGYRAVPAIMEAKVPPLPSMIKSNREKRYILW
jgi:eukaryotic-like serine/threonine-protein kinase